MRTPLLAMLLGLLVLPLALAGGSSTSEDPERDGLYVVDTAGLVHGPCDDGASDIVRLQVLVEDGWLDVHLTMRDLASPSVTCGPLAMPRVYQYAFVRLGEGCNLLGFIVCSPAREPTSVSFFAERDEDSAIWLYNTVVTLPNGRSFACFYGLSVVDDTISWRIPVEAQAAPGCRGNSWSLVGTSHVPEVDVISWAAPDGTMLAYVPMHDRHSGTRIEF